MLRKPDWDTWLDMADLYASRMSGCKKVSVGSVIVGNNSTTVMGFGANRAIPDLCTVTECMRIQKYGNNDKTHRGPGDCRAIHSEVDAICNASAPVRGATIYVTRYPCEACARAIVSAGIKKVIYGRQQQITPETANIFESSGVDVVWNKRWDAVDVEN